AAGAVGHKSNALHEVRHDSCICAYRICLEGEVVGKTHEVEFKSFQIVAANDFFENAEEVLAHFRNGIIQRFLAPSFISTDPVFRMHLPEWTEKRTGGFVNIMKLVHSVAQHRFHAPQAGAVHHETHRIDSVTS